MQTERTPQSLFLLYYLLPLLVKKTTTKSSVNYFSQISVAGIKNKKISNFGKSLILPNPQVKAKKPHFLPDISY